MNARTGTPPHAIHRFIAAAASCAVVLFGVSRLSATQMYILLPLTRAQGELARWYDGVPTLPIAVTLECSAADVMAVCLAFTLAYPVRWRQRIAGAVLGLTWILALNTVRLATLGRVAITPLFVPLHLYVWPSLLIAATLGYMILWLGIVERWWTASVELDSPKTRFLSSSAVCVAAFAAILPPLYRSHVLVAPSRWVAGVVGAILTSAGYAVTVGDNILYTRVGPFIVTPECLTTPLMPLYVAAVISLAPTRRSRLIGLLAFVPAFGVLMLARLLTVALPPLAADSPLLVTHAFFQLLLGLLAVAAACASRRGADDGGLRWAVSAAAIVVAGLGIAWTGTRAYNVLVTAGAARLATIVPHTLTSLRQAGDLQGALFLLPIFQITLFGALWAALWGAAGWRRAAAGTLVLYLAQLGLLAFAGEMQARLLFDLPVTLLRGWALAAPILLVWLLGRTLGPEYGDWTWRRAATHGR